MVGGYSELERHSRNVFFNTITEAKYAEQGYQNRHRLADTSHTFLSSKSCRQPAALAKTMSCGIRGPRKARNCRAMSEDFSHIEDRGRRSVSMNILEIMLIFRGSKIDLTCRMTQHFIRQHKCEQEAAETQTCFHGGKCGNKQIMV